MNDTQKECKHYIDNTGMCFGGVCGTRDPCPYFTTKYTWFSVVWRIILVMVVSFGLITIFGYFMLEPMSQIVKLVK
jgi:hypothetical protein